MSEAADILVVDDNSTNLELLSDVLETHGYRCRVATSGRRAFAAFAARRPDLVLLDITMPEMDGYDVCLQLKADPATAAVPVLFLSALGEAFDKVRAFEVGGADYISKPFQIPEVIARIEHQLRLARLTDDLARRNQELASMNEELIDLSMRLEAANAELGRLSVTDPLTGIANRRRFDETLEAEWRRHLRSGRPLSLVMLDIDHFKLYNDALGHPAGDACLKAVAGAVQDVLRRSGELVARYGGEELAIVLPEVEVDVARTQAERIRAAIADLAIPHPASAVAAVVTASLGCATRAPIEGQSSSELVIAADRALYDAKAGGRNMVV